MTNKKKAEEIPLVF